MKANSGVTVAIVGAIETIAADQPQLESPADIRLVPKSFLPPAVQVAVEAVVYLEILHSLLDCVAAPEPSMSLLEMAG